MRKGFTLIELLAVIVILAIIALIATPIALDIISDSKESTQLSSANMYLNAVEQTIVKTRIKDPKFNPSTCYINGADNKYLTCEGYNNEIKVSVKGDIPNSGKIIIENGITSFVELKYTNGKLVVMNEKGILEYSKEDENIQSDNSEIALTNISVTYTGGDVIASTSINSLTGIIVTAHYSDGSTSNITDYKLNGTIEEGNNIIEVSYGGKIATFTVTGISNIGVYVLYAELTQDDMVLGQLLTSAPDYYKSKYMDLKEIYRISYVDKTSKKILIEQGYSYKIEFEGNISHVGVQQYNQTTADILLDSKISYAENDKYDSGWKTNGYEFTQATINGLPAVSFFLTFRNSSSSTLTIDDFISCKIYRKVI